MTFWLNNEYARWTTDPDDPAVKNAKKTKPPPVPLIAPVAHRPPSVLEAYLQGYARLVEQHGTADPPRSARERARTRWVTSDEVDAVIDAM